jgi:hypothetical protein
MLALSSIPANNDLLGFFQSCKSPTQFHNILAHCVFGYFLFFNPQGKRLGRCTFERGGVKIDIAGPRPILLQDAIDVTERCGLLFLFVKAGHYYQPPHNDPDDPDDDRYESPPKFHARLPSQKTRNSAV